MTSSHKQLDNLVDAFVDDILAMTDEEIEAEMREDGLDPAVEADRMRKLIDDVIGRTAKAIK
jgi:hypothetical protein